MLEAVDQIESSPRQRPNDASPGELAAALRALALVTSDQTAERAYHRVLSAVGNDHRGSYFPIVLDAVPYIGEILTEGAPLARARSLDILIDLVASFGPDPEVVADHEIRPEDLPRLLRARIDTLRPILEALREDSSVPSAQPLARDLLGYLTDEP